MHIGTLSLEVLSFKWSERTFSGVNMEAEAGKVADRDEGVKISAPETRTWGSHPALLPPPSWATSGKSLTLSGPQFPCLQNRSNSSCLTALLGETCVHRGG